NSLSKSSLEIEQLQFRASRSTENKFSQMLTYKTRSMIEDSISTSLTDSNQKRTHSKSTELASINTTSENTTKETSSKNTTEVTTLKNTTKAIILKIQLKLLLRQIQLKKLLRKYN
ncbi:9599_t:CDS:2, partial [Funneliformis geosporum]